MLRLLTARNPPRNWAGLGVAGQFGFSDRACGCWCPGCLQHRWGQRQRGWVFFGSFASALIVALWTWGTRSRAAVFLRSRSDARRFGHRRSSSGVVSRLSRQASAFARRRVAGDCLVPAGRHSLVRVARGPDSSRPTPVSGFLVNRYAYRVTAGPARANGSG